MKCFATLTPTGEIVWFRKAPMEAGCYAPGEGTFNTPHDQWLDGQFVHPHDACFTPDGDIIVAEWVATGRVTTLARV